MAEFNNNKKTLDELAKYLRIGRKQHQVTVHPNGRCLIRAKAVKRFRLDRFTKVCVIFNDKGAELLFNNMSGNAVVHPLIGGVCCQCVYFFSRPIAHRAASTGGNRFRFILLDNKPDELLLQLTFTPVMDFFRLINNK